jgi:hypothetical protein
MSAIKLSTPSSGSISLSPADTASNLTITVPAVTTTMVGTDATQTLTNKTLTTPNINSAQVATVTGTAPLYMCRAWVNFNGTGTIAIRASGNVSSITDLGAGAYRVNFTTAMPDANYAASGVAGEMSYGGILYITDAYFTTGYFDFLTFPNAVPAGSADVSAATISIFR